MDAYRIFTNPDLTVYKLFHDKEWVRHIQDKSKGTKLDEPLFILNMVWYSYSNMFSLPSTFMEITKSISDGQGEAHVQGRQDFLRAIHHKLVEQNAYGLTGVKRNEISADFKRIDSKLDAIKQSDEGTLNRVGLFAECVNADKFGFGSGLAALIQQCFCGIYFAYDDYVKRCFWALGGDKEIRTSSPKFYSQLNEKLKDDSVYMDCWTCNEVKLAKNARSLIAHSSGIFQDNYEEYEDYYLLDKAHKRLFIHADGVKKLYSNLRVCAEKLSQHVLAML